MKNYKAKLSKINTFIFDFDGVLSDGMVMITDDGKYLRKSNVKDGYALQLANKCGFNIAIISGGSGQSMAQRLFSLDIKDVYLGVSNKIEKYNEVKEKYNLKDENIVYMGDDIPDYEVMKTVGLAVCPADAAQEIKDIADYISDKKGGEGCVRDIIEQVLKIHKKWMNGDAYKW